MAPFADVRAFVDGQADRTGKTVKGRPVVSAADVRAIGCDRIVLASCWYGSMQDEVRRVGVRDSQIDVFPQWRLSLPRQKFTSSLTSV